MSVNRAFLRLFVGVSVITTAAVETGTRAAGHRSAVLTVLTAVLTTLAIAGLALLARIVLIAEFRRNRR